MSDFDGGDQGAASTSAQTQETLKFRDAQVTQPLQQQQQQQQQKQEEGELQIVLKNEDDSGMAQGQIILPNMDPDSPEMAALLERIRQGALQVAEDGTIVITADSLKDIPGLQTLAEPEPKEPPPEYDWEEGTINPETAEIEKLEDDAFMEPEPDVQYDELFVSMWDDSDDEEDKRKLKFRLESDRIDVSYVNIADKSQDEFVSDLSPRKHLLGFKSCVFKRQYSKVHYCNIFISLK